MLGVKTEIFFSVKEISFLFFEQISSSYNLPFRKLFFRLFGYIGHYWSLDNPFCTAAASFANKNQFMETHSNIRSICPFEKEDSCLEPLQDSGKYIFLVRPISVLIQFPTRRGMCSFNGKAGLDGIEVFS